MIAKLSTLRQCIQQLCYPKINISIKSNQWIWFHNYDSKCNFMLYLLSTTINGCVWTGQLDRGPALENMFWFASPPLSHECDPQNKLFQLPLYSVHASLWQQQGVYTTTTPPPQSGTHRKIHFWKTFLGKFEILKLLVGGRQPKENACTFKCFHVTPRRVQLWVVVHLKSTSIHPNIIFNLQKLISAYGLS